MFNKYQTEYSEEYIDNLPAEIKEQYYDFITNVPYIKEFIKADRLYAKDLPKDEKGKIIVDITKPHILEDTNYFRPSAIHYKKYGCYTKLRPNSNPNSEYGKWIREEIRRCWEGYIRESDGEWIPGDLYFFLNYCPIQLIKKDENGKSIRTVDFPRFWDGHYYKSHYLYQCRQQGHHAAELASRGKGKAHPYSQKVLTPFGWRRWADIQVGDYLYGDDGQPTRVVAIPYNETTDIYTVTLRDGRKIQCSDGHLFKVKDHRKKKEVVKSLLEIMQDYKVNRKLNSKNPKGVEYNYRIPKMSAPIYYPSTRVEMDPYTLGLLIGDGCFRVPTAKNYIAFTCQKEDYYTYEENIPYPIVKVSKDEYSYHIRCSNEYLRNCGLYGLKSEYKFIPKEYLFNSANVRLELLRGLMDSDGTVDKTSGIPVFNTTSERLRDDFEFLCRSLGFNISTSRHKSKFKGVQYIDHYRIRVITDTPIFKLNRKNKLVSKFTTGYSKSTRDYTGIVDIQFSHREMAKCVTVDNKSHCYIIGDFVVTHNSYYAAAMLAKRFILGESKDVNKKVQCVATASERKYIQGANQLLDMFQYYIDFNSNNTEFPRQRLTSSLQNLAWTMGYLDSETLTRRGTENSVIGITSKDDESKLRGSRGVLYLLEEAGCHIEGTKVLMANGQTKKVEDIEINDTLMGDDGTPRKVLELHSGVDDMYKITLSNGDTQIVNSKHLIYYKKYNWSTKQYTYHTGTPKEVLSIKNLNKGYYIMKSNKVEFKEKETPFSPYWLGLWLGDGDKTRMAISNEDPEVLEWIRKYCNDNNYNYQERFLSQSNNCYNINISAKNDVFNDFKSLGLINNKHIPDIFKFNSKEVLLQILAGIIDTDGNLNRKKQYYEITQVYKNKQIIDDVRYICHVLGFKTSVTTRFNSNSSKSAGTLNYRLRISGDINTIPVKIKRKQIVKNHTYRNRLNWNDYTFKVEYYGKGKFYGFTVDKNNLFLLDDFTIVHNSFPRLLNLYQVLRPSVEDGNSVWGTIFLYGTAGDAESDFSSMQELMYNPKGYNIQSVTNVYDKEGQGRRLIRFRKSSSVKIRRTA